MLEVMRTKAASWVVRILAVFLIASFAVWGIGDIFRGRTAPTNVAEVGGIEITRQELGLEFRRLVNELRNQLGPQFDSQQAIQLGLLERTLDQMIDGRLLWLEAQRLRLDAGEDQLRRTIRGNSGFRGPGNAFDPVRFREFLSSRGFTEAGYVAALRRNIVANQIRAALTAGVTAPKILVDLVYDYRNERRVAAVVTVAPSAEDAAAAPDAATLAEFHRANTALFTAPEYRRLTVVYLDPAQRAAEIQPSEERLREEYESRLPSLTVPERRTVRQILVQDEAVAKKAYAALKEGRAFETVAAEIAKTKPTALGTVRRRDLPGDLGKAAFALAAGGISAPIKSPLGWHILRVDKIEPGKAPRFEEVRKKIRDDVAREMAVDDLVRLTNRLDDALAGGASLEDAAAKVDAKLIVVDAIDAEGRDAAGKPVAGVPRDPKFLETAFQLGQGEVSSIEETKDGGFFLIRVDSITPPTLRPLEQVREKVIAEWKRRQREKAAKARAEALLAEAKAAGSLAAAAARRGFAVTTSKPFTRFVRAPGSPVTDALAAALFRVAERGIVMAPAADGFVVGELEKIIPADVEKNAEAVAKLRDRLQRETADDFLAQYIETLRQRYTVTVNREAFDLVAGGGA